MIARRGPALLAAAAAMLAPWTAGLAFGLPATATARHWNVAWAGLDVAIAVGLALTASLAGRPAGAPVSSATGALMCADAWFDLCTSGPGAPLDWALTEAALELPLAALCVAVGCRAIRSARAVPAPEVRSFG